MASRERARRAILPDRDAAVSQLNHAHTRGGCGRSPRQEIVTDRTLNVLQVCDHLGWEGSRMHGVKRLFAWMIPRFDKSRFNVSLISLRRKDLSEDTLEQFGIDVSYLSRHKFDPATYTALNTSREKVTAEAPLETRR